MKSTSKIHRAAIARTGKEAHGKCVGNIVLDAYRNVVPMTVLGSVMKVPEDEKVDFAGGKDHLPIRKVCADHVG